MFRGSQERYRIVQGDSGAFHWVLWTFHVSRGLRGVPEAFYTASGGFLERSRGFMRVSVVFQGFSDGFRSIPCDFGNVLVCSRKGFQKRSRVFKGFQGRFSKFQGCSRGFSGILEVFQG